MSVWPSYGIMGLGNFAFGANPSLDVPAIHFPNLP